MPCPMGNSEFCFTETPDVSQGKAKGNTEVDGKQNSLFPVGPVIKCFVIPPNQTLQKNWGNSLLYAGWLVNLLRFQGAQPDHVGVKSPCGCFPRELVSLDPRHVTHFPQTYLSREIWQYHLHLKRLPALASNASYFQDFEEHQEHEYGLLKGRMIKWNRM